MATFSVKSILISHLQTFSWRFNRTPERFGDWSYLCSFRWTSLYSPVSYHLEGANLISGCNIANGWFSSTKGPIENHFKRHNIMGYRKWLTDAKVVTPGSAEATVEGRHYYKNMRRFPRLWTKLSEQKLKWPYIL